MMRVFIVMASCCLTCIAQDSHTNIITAGVGYGWNLKPATSQHESGLNLSATYEWRFLRNVGIEAGALTLQQPTPDFGHSSGLYNPDDQFVWTPFG